MPQIQLPIFPTGSTKITNELAFEQRDGQVVYFNGHLPVFTHGASDVRSFRFFTTQLIINGSASQGQISRAFGVPLTTVKRCCKKFKMHGPEVFFVPPAKRHGRRLTPERLAEAQTHLDEGRGVPEISAMLGVLATTIHKAIDDGRLRQKKKRPRRIQLPSPSAPLRPRANAA